MLATKRSTMTLSERLASASSGTTTSPEKKGTWDKMQANQAQLGEIDLKKQDAKAVEAEDAVQARELQRTQLAMEQEVAHFRAATKPGRTRSWQKRCIPSPHREKSRDHIARPPCMVKGGVLRRGGLQDTTQTIMFRLQAGESLTLQLQFPEGQTGSTPTTDQGIADHRDRGHNDEGSADRQG